MGTPIQNKRNGVVLIKLAEVLCFPSCRNGFYIAGAALRHRVSDQSTCMRSKPELSATDPAALERLKGKYKED